MIRKAKAEKAKPSVGEKLVEKVQEGAAAVEHVAEEALAHLAPTFHGEVSLRARLAHTFGPLTVKPVLGYTPLITPVFMSLKTLDLLAGVYPRGSRVTRTTVDTPTWTAHLYTPETVTCSKVMVYFHGGAFLSGGLGTHRRIVEHLALANECVILSVAYRQYPQVKFDTTVQDCMEAVGWLEDQGYTANDLILVGDSAGGGLALRVAGDLLQQRKKVAGVVAMSGWLDFDISAKRDHRWGRKDAYIPVRRLEGVARMILGRDPRPEDSPLASLQEGFPPLLLICGASEILRVDTEAAHQRCGELGIPCQTHFFRGGVHAFPVATTLFPEGHQALQLMRAFVTDIMARESKEAA